MANLKSSKKRIRTNRKREARNTAAKSTIKTMIKNVDAAIAEGDLEAAQKKYSEAVSALDSAATKKIMKKNTASRRKSRLARNLNAARSATQ